jgi:hypothetical protein
VNQSIGSGSLRRGQSHPWLSAGLALLLVIAIGAAVHVGKDVFLDRAAQHHLGLARMAHFAATPDLDLARREYLLALQARPELGEAHYYLGHLLLRTREFDTARNHFAAALRDLEGLPAGHRPEAMRLLTGLTRDAEPPALQRTLDSLAVKLGDAASAAGTFEIPTEPTAAGRPVAPAKPGKQDIVVAAAAAERVALAAQRPAPSPDFLFAEDSQAIATLARRVPASTQVLREVSSQLEALYADDAHRRLSAASALAIAPDLNSDTVPGAIDRAETSVLQHRGSPGVAQARQVTLSLLQAASPLTLALNRQAILRLLDATAVLGPDARLAAEQVHKRVAAITRLPRPVVYLQIAHEAQRPVALQLAARLTADGWVTPELDVVHERAPERTEVRSQGTSHQGLARWLRQLTSETTGEAADLSPLRRAAPAGDVYEVWLDKDLCVAPKRLVPGCLD